VTLLDFGISRILDDDSEITRTGEIVGTIAYCSPEQLSHQPVGGGVTSTRWRASPTSA
jgi:serine/threonine protein kinase